MRFLVSNLNILIIFVIILRFLLSCEVDDFFFLIHTLLTLILSTDRYIIKYVEKGILYMKKYIRFTDKMFFNLPDEYDIKNRMKSIIFRLINQYGHNRNFNSTNMRYS